MASHAIHEEENPAPFGPITAILNTATMAEAAKKCPFCGHSGAAHTDGVHCALCRCRSEEMSPVQESFAFRTMVTSARDRITRKR